MIKKITLLAALLTLSGCAISAANNQCDPEKNYINSNPEAMENYKELFRKGEVKSYYSKVIPTSLCSNQNCFKYNSKLYDFQERYFDDDSRHGIYTIKINENKNDDNCYIKKYSTDKNCYIVTKNINNSIQSRFYVEIVINKNVTYKKFVDLNTNTVLFEASFQRYKTASISGAPSGGLCPIKNNHENYQFNILDYP